MQVSVNKIIQAGSVEGALYGLCLGSTQTDFFSCGSDKKLQQWSLIEHLHSVFALQFPQSLYAVCFIENKDFLITGAGDGWVVVLSLKTKSVVKEFKHHRSVIFDIIYSAQHELIIVACGDGSVSFIDAENLLVKKQVQICREKIRDLSLSPIQCELAIACGDGTIRIFDLANLEEKESFVAHQFSTTAVRFHPNGKLLVSGGKDAHLKVWERNAASKLSCIESIPAHNYAIYSIEFHPQLNIFATGSRDKTIKIWNSSSFDFLLRISKENNEGHVNSVNKLLWNLPGNQLISCGDDRSIIVWDIAVLS
ncbi:MAG: WD40 repeat domain-containing protein [Bacteroidetes bacterium]|nr:WD40 repeat domain-containing protein [Bacteroidota bacterium]